MSSETGTCQLFRSADVASADLIGDLNFVEDRTSLTKAPKRKEASLCFLKNEKSQKAYVFMTGGCAITQNRCLKSVQRYEVALDKWTKMPSLRTAR